MRKPPQELIDFTQRHVPIFIHLAAAMPNEVPFLCRGYGFELDAGTERLWVYILKNQGLRLKEYGRPLGILSALLTSGVDNESYQLKGRFADVRSLSKEDASLLAERHRWVALHTPALAPIVRVNASDCLAVGLRVQTVYVQTPGPNAGFPLWEGGDR
ncbi:hypothetical protein [Cohnella caldifontis]|uniref:hypothetical protein n=1 Tax=Cohnella caldifontis TaxID=3027471 RepID=UPI0023EC541A|nr:hypothetical protein [Cohnella sp. YIM B05605]